MFLIITLNVLFAILVVGGIVGLLGHSVWASRTPAAPRHLAGASASSRTRATLRPSADMA